MKPDEFSEGAMAAKAEFMKAMAVTCPACGEPNHPIVARCVKCAADLHGAAPYVEQANQNLYERLQALDADLVNARTPRDHASEEARHYRLLWETVSACLREIAVYVFRPKGNLGFLELECIICGGVHAPAGAVTRRQLDARLVRHRLGCVMHNVDTLLYEPSKNTTPDAEETR